MSQQSQPQRQQQQQHAQYDQQQQQSQIPQTPHFNSGIPSFSMQPPLSTVASSHNSADRRSIMGSNGSGVGSNTNIAARNWASSSIMRQSIGPGASGGSSSSSAARRRRSMRSSMALQQQQQQPPLMGQLTMGDHGHYQSSQHQANFRNSIMGESPMGPPKGNSRASIRSSIAGPGITNRFGGLGGLSYAPPKDVRPISDKAYQRQIVQDLTMFLPEAGYALPITPQTFSRPANKDFQEIFRFMYQKLDPKFSFTVGETKKVEEEVFMLIKTMKYPSADSINRNALQTVGTPHSWHHLLALLGWMMDLNRVMDRFNFESQQVAQQLQPSPIRLRDVDEKLDLTKHDSGKVQYHYLLMTYRNWMLSRNEENQLIEEQLKRSFEGRQELIRIELERQMADNQVLDQELQAALQEVDPLPVLVKERNILERDVSKFEEAITMTYPRMEEVGKANGQDTIELQTLVQECQDVDRAIQEMHYRVQHQKISKREMQESENRLKELESNKDRLMKQQEKLIREIKEVENRTTKQYQEVERLVWSQNDAADQIGLTPSSSGQFAEGVDYEVRLKQNQGSSGMYENDTTMTQQQQAQPQQQSGFFTTDPSRVRSKVHTLKLRFANEIQQLERQTRQDGSDIDSVQERIQDLDRDIATVENRQQALRRNHADDREAHRQNVAHMEGVNQTFQEQELETDLALKNAEEDKLVADSLILALEKQAALNRQRADQEMEVIREQFEKYKQHTTQQIGMVCTMADSVHQAMSKESEDMQRLSSPAGSFTLSGE